MKKCTLTGVIVSLLLSIGSFAVGANAATNKPSPDEITQIDKRREFVLDVVRAAPLTASSPKFHAYDVLGATAADGCGAAAQSDYMANILYTDGGGHPIKPGDGKTPEMFALPALVRYLYQFGSCLDQSQKDKIKAGLSGKIDLFAHGTLNHAVIQATSWYLLAQYFPDVTWQDKDGKYYSSQQVMARLRGLLMARTWRFYQNGQYEQFSPTYAMIDLFPVLNMVDFATDTKTKDFANAEATLAVASLRAVSFHGVIMPPLTRRISDQRTNGAPALGFDPINSQQLLWFYFGEPSISSFDIESRRDPIYIIMLAISSWRPPLTLLKIKNQITGDYIGHTVTPSFGQWGNATVADEFGYYYFSNNFAVSTGNGSFEPGGYNDHNQSFAIQIKDTGLNGQIQCYQPYWNSNLGEAAWSTDRSSPFVEAYQAESSGALIFSIPKTDPWVFTEKNAAFSQRNKHSADLLQTLTCKYPVAVDEIIKKKDGLFLRKGKTYVALRTANGSNEYSSLTAREQAFGVLNVRSPAGALYFHVVSGPDSLTFENFIQLEEGRKLSFDKESSTISIGEGSDLRQIAFSLKSVSPIAPNTPRVEGIPLVRGGQQYSNSDFVIDTPFIKLRDGGLSIVDGTDSAKFVVVNNKAGCVDETCFSVSSSAKR